MYCLAPEKILRLVYGTFYLAIISLIKDFLRVHHRVDHYNPLARHMLWNLQDTTKKTIVNRTSMSKHNQTGKNAPCPKAERINTVAYDNGDNGATHCAQAGICSIGTNIPLTKSSGRRTKLDSSMMLEGPLAGGAARSTPNAAKLNAPITIPAIRTGTLAIEVSVSTSPIRTGTTERQAPKTRPLITSPASIEGIDTGMEIKRS